MEVNKELMVLNNSSTAVSTTTELVNSFVFKNFYSVFLWFPILLHLQLHHPKQDLYIQSINLFPTFAKSFLHSSSH